MRTDFYHDHDEREGSSADTHNYLWLSKRKRLNMQDRRGKLADLILDIYLQMYITKMMKFRCACFTILLIILGSSKFDFCPRSDICTTVPPPQATTTMAATIVITGARDVPWPEVGFIPKGLISFGIGPFVQLATPPSTSISKKFLIRKSGWASTSLKLPELKLKLRWSCRWSCRSLKHPDVSFQSAF